MGLVARCSNAQLEARLTLFCKQLDHVYHFLWKSKQALDWKMDAGCGINECRVDYLLEMN